MTDCVTCELVQRRNDGDAPPWDAIARTEGWDVVHAFGTSLEGWLVLVLRRHATAVADLTNNEAAELGLLIRDVSAALHAVTGCEKTYVAQFAEHPQHRHVHVHLVPRAGDLPDEHQGPRVFNLLGVPDADCVPIDRMDDLASRVMQHLAGRSTGS